MEPKNLAITASFTTEKNVVAREREASNAAALVEARAQLTETMPERMAKFTAMAAAADYMGAGRLPAVSPSLSVAELPVESDKSRRTAPRAIFAVVENIYDRTVDQTTSLDIRLNPTEVRVSYWLESDEPTDPDGVVLDEAKELRSPATYPAETVWAVPIGVERFHRDGVEIPNPDDDGNPPIILFKLKTPNGQETAHLVEQAEIVKDDLKRMSDTLRLLQNGIPPDSEYAEHLAQLTGDTTFIIPHQPLDQLPETA